MFTQKELNTKVRKIRKMQHQLEEMQKQLDEMKDELKDAMDAEGVTQLTGPDWKATYSTINSTRFDTKGFKLCHGDLYQQFSIPTTCRRFVVA